jgi:hypothetical protein
MLRLILFIFLIIFIFPINCQPRSIALQEPSLCINNSYVIPLFSIRNFRMTLNRTRLRQLNIHTVSVYATIADRKIAEFQNRRQTIRKVYHIPNDTQGKFNSP